MVWAVLCSAIFFKENSDGNFPDVTSSTITSLSAPCFFFAVDDVTLCEEIKNGDVIASGSIEDISGGGTSKN